MVTQGIAREGYAFKIGEPARAGEVERRTK